MAKPPKLQAYYKHPDGTIEDVSDRVYTRTDHVLERISQYKGTIMGTLTAGIIFAAATYAGPLLNEAIDKEDYGYAVKMLPIQKENCRQGDDANWCEAYERNLEFLAAMESKYPELK